MEIINILIVVLIKGMKTKWMMSKEVYKNNYQKLLKKGSLLTKLLKQEN